MIVQERSCRCNLIMEEKMKVTDVKIFNTDCFRTNWVFVKVYTDEGIDGVGEATLEYKEKALVGAVEHIRDQSAHRPSTHAIGTTGIVAFLKGQHARVAIRISHACLHME